MAQQKQTPAPPAYQVTTRLVSVDVVVEDGQGNVVRGFKQGDFSVAEDGKAQEIVDFSDHTGAAEASPTVVGEGGQYQFSNLHGTVRGRGVSMILFDLQNTPTLEQPYARKQMIQFLEKLPSGGQTALFVLTERLHMVQGFTSSTDDLVKAARAMETEPSMLVKSEGDRQQEDDRFARLKQAAGRSPSAIRLNEALGFEQVVADRARSQSTALALQQIAAAASGYPGRKNLLWLSGSFPVGLGATLQLNTTVRAITLPGVAEAATALASSQIAVYPISLQGVATQGMSAEVQGASLADSANGMGSTLGRQFEERYVLRTSMEEIATETGGRAFYSTNDLAGAMRQGFASGDQYYTLQYRPARHEWDGSFRRISVKLRQKGYRLMYRQGYYATPLGAGAENAAQSMQAAVQQGETEATGIPLHANIQWVAGDKPGASVGGLIDTTAVTFTPDASGLMRGKLLVELAERTPAGAAPHETTAVMNLGLEPMDYDSLLRLGIPFRLTLAGVAGKTALRLGVRDLNSGRMGTLDLPAKGVDQGAVKQVR